MSIKLREFHRPAGEDRALELLRRSEVPAAPLMLGPRVPETLYPGAEAAVDLSQLALAYVREAEGAVRLGAMTPLHDVAESALVRSFASGLLAQAAHLAAGSALRNAATLGGAVRPFLGAATGLAPDGPPEIVLALLVLDAAMIVAGAGGVRRAVLLPALLAAGDAVQPEELIVEFVLARPPAGARGALARVARTPRDQAIVAAAALVASGGGRAEVVRLAVAGAAPRPQRLPHVETRLAGEALIDAALQATERLVAAEMNPPADFRGSADYRRAMAGVLARRALAACRE